MFPVETDELHSGKLPTLVEGKHKALQCSFLSLEGLFECLNGKAAAIMRAGFSGYRFLLGGITGFLMVQIVIICVWIYRCNHCGIGDTAKNK